MLSSLGHIPSEGEVLEMPTISVEITNMKGLKIEAVKLIKKPVHEPSD